MFREGVLEKIQGNESVLCAQSYFNTYSNVDSSNQVVLPVTLSGVNGVGSYL